MNWIDSQCGSPRGVSSKCSIASHEELAAPFPVGQNVEPGAAEDRSARSQPVADRVDGRPRSQRKTAEVELFELELADQFLKVPDQHVRWIIGGIVRLAAFPVGAQVGHDHAEALARDAVGMAELDPVHLRVGEEPVEQDDRPALAHLVIGELDAVGGGPAVNCDLSRRMFSMFTLTSRAQAIGDRMNPRQLRYGRGERNGMPAVMSADILLCICRRASTRGVVQRSVWVALTYVTVANRSGDFMAARPDLSSVRLASI